VAAKRKVLITGAAGRIGSFLTGYLAGTYDLVLSDIHQPTNRQGFPFVEADLSDLAAMRALCQGVDTVVHMGADPRTDAPWETLLPSNIVGVYNIFEAAHAAGCRRVIFASSINAVGGYPDDVQVRTDMPVRPLNLYGASKCWGEAVACFYADQRGLPAICLRFGWVQPADGSFAHGDPGWLDLVLTYEDLGKLVERSIEAPAELRFGIFHGLSNNRWKRLDISDARELLGFEPADDAFALADAFKRPAEARSLPQSSTGQSDPGT
jgi:nucleoside-diphosphate-sugar epimerase